jgi:predicted MFS family arabinose efflux permease
LRALYLLILLTFLCHCTAAGARVALSLHAISLGASALTVGVLLGVYGVVPMLSAVAAGRLSDRIGARVPMLVGAAGIALGAAVPFAWPTLAGLFVSSAVVGSGFMLYNVAMQNVAGHIGRPEDRATNLSVMALGFSVSIMVGPMMAGVSIDAIGHRSTFLLFTLLPLVAVAILACGLLRVPHIARQRQGASHGVLDLLRDPGLVKLWIVTGLLSVAWELYTFVIPVYGSEVGLSPTAIGLIMGSFSAAILAVRVVLPLVAKRLDALHVIATTLAYAGALFVFFPLSTSAWALAVLSFLLGLGLRQAIIYATQVFMPVMFGAAGSAFGLAAVFWASALVFAAGGLYGRRR